MNLLEREVAAFNEGVRTGDWSALVQLFAVDAELVFEGIAVGSYHGYERFS